MSLGDRRSEIPSSAQKNLPEGQLRRLLSGALMFTSTISDLRNKNAKTKIPRIRTILRRDIRRPDLPAYGVTRTAMRSEWVMKPMVGAAQKATRMSIGICQGGNQTSLSTILPMTG